MPVEPANGPAPVPQPTPPTSLRIYAAADIHDRPSRLARMDKIIREEKPDVLVLAGDLINYRRPVHVVEWFRSQRLPVLVVRGNTDPMRHWEAIRKIPQVRDMHLAATKIEGCRFTGIGGTFLLPLRSKVAFRERQAVSRLAALVQPGDVLIMHPPPYGCRDRVLRHFHSGSRSLAALIESARPSVAICGHIHEHGGCEKSGGTMVVNCTMGRGGSGAIIEMAAGRHPAVRMA